MIEGDSGPTKDAADPMVGRVLNGRFSIIEVIGTGGMGRVYKAVQSPLDRIVALKVLNPHYGAGGRDPNFQRRFFLEASLTSKLRSPNTITVHDYGKTDDGIYYIAMEYVEGQTLAQVLTTNGPLPWQRALHVGQQICRSLREAHKSGIVHRDLKPANVMLLTEETDHDLVKVLDFGLVKSMGTDEPEITQAGVMLGSPLYMAPEQARHIADARSDIYSLGVVLFQMLMGRPPFMAKESVDAIVKHLSTPPPTFASLRPELGVPSEIEAVVMKCLEKDPEQRYQSMDELLDGMRRAAAAQGVSGLFADPRTMSDGSRPALSGVEAPKLPPPLPGPGVNEGADVAATRAERSSPMPAAGKSVEIELGARDEVAPARRFLFAGVFAAAVLVGGVIVFLLAQSGTEGDLTPPRPPIPPQVEKAKVLPKNATPPVERPAAVVRFKVGSEPPGARVSIGPIRLGETPLELTRRVGANGIAEVALTFSMDGYLPVTSVARGRGPEVAVTQRLAKKRAPTTKRPRDPKRPADGYKDDPY